MRAPLPPLSKPPSVRPVWSLPYALARSVAVIVVVAGGGFARFFSLRLHLFIQRMQRDWRVSAAAMAIEGGVSLEACPLSRWGGISPLPAAWAFYVNARCS